MPSREKSKSKRASRSSRAKSAGAAKPALAPTGSAKSTAASKNNAPPKPHRFRNAQQFVDAVFAAHDPVLAAGKLLSKERFFDKLIELRFGKPSAAGETADAAPRIVFDMPGPEREREKSEDQPDREKTA